MRGQAKVGLLSLLVLVVGAVGYGVMTYNRLIRLREQIPAAWSQVENVLQRRNDLIPNLVHTVQGYAKHEQAVFDHIARARAALVGARTLEEKVDANNQMTSALSRLLLVVENYPNLKANENFLRLQDELAGTENRVAVERMRFNDTVKEYNTLVKMFPTNLIARLGGFSSQEAYFKAAESAKTVPQVNF